MEMSQYLDIFIEESKEHLQSMNEQVLLLEKQPDELSIVQEIFRSAHTLKGMSASMGYEDLANLTHIMENVLDGIRNHKLTVTQEILDALFVSIDHLEEMVLSIGNGGDGKKDVEDIVRLLHAIESGKSEEPPQNKQEQSKAGQAIFDEYELTIMKQSLEQNFHVYQISVELRDDCLLKAVRAYMAFETLEQMGEVVKSVPSVDLIEQEKFEREFQVTLISKEQPETIQNNLLKVSEIDKVSVESIMAEHIVQNEAEEADPEEEKTGADMKGEPAQKTSSSAGSKTIRVNIDRLDRLMNLFEELVIDRGRLEKISKDLKSNDLNETVERMSRISSDLQDIILNMRMVPVDQVFNRFPRMIRGLAKDLGKSVSLEITGAETELDRTVIDEIGDPLVHLLRNSIDHGIEKPEKRAEAGKSKIGTIHLRAYHSGNHVFIEIQDDGAGINRHKVLERAIERGIVNRELSEDFTDKQVFELLFASGFSTADVISDISGRGVGLDAVKNKIESLGGFVTVDSREGSGSLFSIQLPLTLSIISSMLVKAGEETYAIPLSSIIETALIKKSDIMTVHHQPMIDFRGKVVPLISLSELFEVPGPGWDEKDRSSVVIVKKGDKMAGLAVDSLIGQQEIVLKSLGNYLASVFAVSGATILGDGQVALILDCNALIK
ncbi:chemotaxis protein CheA [Fictibacillus sp. KIGAM418]|uniref:Chemotaxis protein CheA n=1 Tax=Fictibacillus marinisediminis TaxID=2878389 RepID=A0A9X1XA16_9BACL|nr:chemotaxis protein CheA [Fictibacillus marinisediminis]MCK6257032.1 chemotaxis protein CheA [Fictibacillus marinisediminis]